ncbi:tetratricopeptide repeat protein [Micromonospora carbonacea]|uniref:fibronectin type III domain-containing protein n=1 Tax=Micromonospora carbonacea TaxID=47853 RepID=UPI003D74161A
MSQPSPLAALQHRALALRAAGDVAGACRLLADAIDPLRASFGEDHPEVLGTAHLLARLHREADDPAAARRVLEGALAAGERRWHPADPLMLAFSFDLASVAEELGNRHEARRHYARVADAGPAVLGADHPAVQAARHYLGGAGPGTTPPVPPAPHAAAPPGPPTPRDSTASPPPFPRQPPLPPPVSGPPQQPPPPPPRIPAPSRSPEFVAPTPHAPGPPHPATASGAPPVSPASATPAAATRPVSGGDAPPQPVSPWAPQAAPPAPRIPAPPRPGPGRQGGPVPHPPAPSATPNPPGPHAPAEPGPQPSSPPAPARGWDEPTIQVRQLDPLLREEAARQEGLRAATEPGGDASSAPTTGAPPVGAPPTSGPVSGAPVSGSPVSGTPVSGTPVSGSPVSGTPVSGSPVPPWGMTAPPWGRVSPSPSPSPAEPVDDELSAPGGAGHPTADGTALPPLGPAPGRRATPVGPGPDAAPAPLAAPAPAPQPQAQAQAQAFQDPSRALGPGHGAVHPDASPPPAPDPRPAARPHRPPWPGREAVEAGPVGPRRAPATPAPAAADWDGQPGRDGPAWPERGGGGPADDYPSPREAWQTTYPEEKQAGRGRVLVVVVVVAALVVVVVVVGVAALVLGRAAGPPPPTTPSVAAGPTVDGPPPGDLELRDDSSTITLTWTDPSAGAMPFMVAGGRAGQKLGVMATVDPGQTSYTVNGLNARVDYCFTVLAVYSTDAFATSGQVCTQRERTATPR